MYPSICDSNTFEFNSLRLIPKSIKKYWKLSKNFLCIIFFSPDQLFKFWTFNTFQCIVVYFWTT